MLIVELYAVWRFMPPGEFISAYGHIGPRAYFMEAEMQATGNGVRIQLPKTASLPEMELERAATGSKTAAMKPARLSCAGSATRR